MKVVFFGTPQFAASVLQFLIDNKIDIAAVVSKPDKPKGRTLQMQPTPVKVVAENHRIPLYQPELASSPEFAATLQKYDADLFVVVAYGEIIKQHLLEMPKLGCINLHASLLPAYRGAAPIHHCLINGEKESGVTIIHMVKKMDAGDMIEKATVPISEEMNYEQLQNRLCEVGKHLFLQVIHDFAKGVIKRMPQDHEKATFAPRVELEDCEIHFDKPAAVLHNLIRGTCPNPGAWCQVVAKGEKKRLKVYGSQVDARQGKPGQVIAYGKELVIGCGEKSLKLLDVQLEGKKRMSAEELMRGVPDLQFQ